MTLDVFSLGVRCAICFFSQNFSRPLSTRENDLDSHTSVSRRLCASPFARVLVPHVAGDGWGALSPARNQLRLDELCVSRNAPRSYRPINNETANGVTRRAREMPADVGRWVLIIVAGCLRIRDRRSAAFLNSFSVTRFFFMYYKRANWIIHTLFLYAASIEALGILLKYSDGATQSWDSVRWETEVYWHPFVGLAAFLFVNIELFMYCFYYNISLL